MDQPFQDPVYRTGGVRVGFEHDPIRPAVLICPPEPPEIDHHRRPGATPKARSIQFTPKVVKSWASNRYDFAAPTGPLLPCPTAKYSSTMASK
jgi:hypothetical protein